MAEAVPNKDIDYKKQATLAGLLTGIFDADEAKEYVNGLGVEFFHPETNSFQSHDRSAKPKPSDLLPKNITRVSIQFKDEEEPRYFEVKAKSGAKTAEEIVTITNKTVDADASGFKALFSLRTTKDGKKPLPNKQGHGEVHLSFPGYVGDGNFNNNGKGNTSQAIAADAAQRRKVYPPTLQVADFINGVQKELKELKGKNPEVKEFDVHIDGHSFGAEMEITAALYCKIKGIPFKSIIEVDPITASLAKENLLNAFSGKDKSEEAKKLVASFNLTPEELKRIPAMLDEVTKKDVVDMPVVWIDKEGKIRSANAAMMEVLSQEISLKENSEKEKDREEYTSAVKGIRLKNVGNTLNLFTKAKAVLERDTGLPLSTNITAITGREDNDLNKRDDMNKPVASGKNLKFILVNRDKLPADTNAKKADRTHALSNITRALQSGDAEILSLEELQAKADKIKKAYEEKKKLEDQKKVGQINYEWNPQKLVETAIDIVSAMPKQPGSPEPPVKPAGPHHGLDGIALASSVDNGKSGGRTI